MRQKPRGEFRYFSVGLILGGILLLGGCDLALMDPKGLIGEEQKSLILTSLGLMLIVVVPVIIMTFVFAWRYRASNKNATYAPDWAHSGKIEAVVWSVPLVIILILGTITWKTTHSLDPRNPLPAAGPPMRIEAVAMDWKWLFIYPEQGVAVVNELALPVNRPVVFYITSQSVMNSFFIPQLGSQLYAMAGMENRLNLVANAVGDYHGISANYSGHGFSGMNFMAHAVEMPQFDAWIAKAKSTGQPLDWAGYMTLTQPSQKHPVTYYSSVPSGLFGRILDQYMGPEGHGKAHAEAGAKEREEPGAGMPMASHAAHEQGR